MMTDRTLWYGLGLAAAVAAAATPPLEGQAPGTYRLVEVAGSALPAEVERDRSCREQVTAGTLTLGADSLWSLRYTKREVCGDRTEEEQEDETGRYSMDRGTIRFHDDDDDNDRDDDDDIDVDDLDTATLGPDGRLTARLEDGRTAVVFRR